MSKNDDYIPRLVDSEIKEKLADVFKTATEGSTSPDSKFIISQLLENVKS